MKKKKYLLLFVVLSVVAGVFTFFILHHQKKARDLIPQEFAKPPEKQNPIAEFNHGNLIWSVAFSPMNSSLIASAGEDNTIKLWDLNNPNMPVTIFRGHTEEVKSIAFSPTGELLVSGSVDGTIILWDMVSKMKINTLKHSVISAVAVSPNGQQLASSGYGSVKLWDIRNPKEIREVGTLPHAAYEYVNAISFSPDGEWIATGSIVLSHDGESVILRELANVKVWNVQNKQLKKSLKGQPEGIESIKFSPDSRFLASGGKGGYIIWDLSDQQTHKEFRHGSSAFFLDFSPVGKMCAGSDGKTIALWSVESGNRITSLGNWQKQDTNLIWSVAFSKDGNRLASGDTGGILRVWDTTPRQLTKVDVTSPYDVVRLIYFLPRGNKPQPNMKKKINRLIREAQQFYARQMKVHKFDGKTFIFETDEDDDSAKVYIVEGQHPEEYYYEDPANKITEEVYEYFYQLKKNIYFIVADVNGEKIGEVDGEGGLTLLNRGLLTAAAYALIYASGDDFSSYLIAHELGHAFGLNHDFRESNLPEGADIMSYDDKVGTYWLSECAAKWLDKSRFFNHDQNFFNQLPNIDLSFSDMDRPNTPRFQFKLEDADGLHQVQLSIPTSFNDLVSIAKRRNYRDPESWAKQKAIIKAAGLKLRSCYLLNGKRAATVEFKLTNASTNKVELRIIDMFGNIAAQEFNLREIAPASIPKP